MKIEKFNFNHASMLEAGSPSPSDVVTQLLCTCTEFIKEQEIWHQFDNIIRASKMIARILHYNSFLTKVSVLCLTSH
jgi:hypothetical protein